MKIECNHIEDTFFMDFSSQNNIKQSDIEIINRKVESFALITKEFIFKTELKMNFKNKITKKFLS